MSLIAANLPPELLEGNCFVGWKWDKRDGSATKVPVNPHTGQLAKVDDPATWSDFETARAAVEKYHLAGIGRVVTDQDKFSGVDLDHCLDPVMHLDSLVDCVVKALDSYTEITPSGNGIRIWISAKLPPGHKCRGKLGDKQIEIYSRERFFTLTGNRLAGTPTTIEPRQAELEQVYAGIFGEPPHETPKAAPAATDGMERFTDIDVIRRATEAKNGAKFVALMAGDTSMHNGDDSVADSALCAHLAFWSRSPGQIDRIFRTSKLYRPKWDERRPGGTYGSNTVLHALGVVQEWYWKEDQKEATPKTTAEEKPSTEWSEVLKVFDSFAEFEAAQPLSFSIEGFLQNDGGTMIGGLGGHGKTFILLSVVKACFAGKGTKLWDLFPVLETAERIVYLIPECSRTPFKHRLKLMGLYDYVASGKLLVRTLSKGATPSLADPRILCAAKGAHVILDTATRFADGDENNASDNARGLASDIFALLAAGARTVLGAHHSPKSFARDTTMSLENVFRGTGDLGNMLTTGWGVKQLDAEQNIIHVENVKPRDFQPCAPFQLIGRPYLDQAGDFRILKRPGECGALEDEQSNDVNEKKHRERFDRMAMMKAWLSEDPNIPVKELVEKFRAAGIDLETNTVYRYRKDLRKEAAG